MSEVVWVKCRSHHCKAMDVHFHQVRSTHGAFWRLLTYDKLFTDIKLTWFIHCWYYFVPSIFISGRIFTGKSSSNWEFKALTHVLHVSSKPDVVLREDASPWLESYKRCSGKFENPWNWADPRRSADSNEKRPPAINPLVKTSFAARISKLQHCQISPKPILIIKYF